MQMQVSWISTSKKTNAKQAKLVFWLMRMFQIPLVLIRWSFHKMSHFQYSPLSTTAPVISITPQCRSVSSRCPLPHSGFHSCSATYNIMHRGACALASQCKCHCATNSNVDETICRQAKGADYHNQFNAENIITFKKQHKKEKRLYSSVNPNCDLRESSYWPHHSSGKDDVKCPLLLSLFGPNSEEF